MNHDNIDTADLLARISTPDLEAEIQRRAYGERAELRRVLDRTYKRHQLTAAIAIAKREMDAAETEHRRLKSNLDQLESMGLSVPAQDVHYAIIKVSQANSSRTEARDRMIQAERAIDAFDAAGR